MPTVRTYSGSSVYDAGKSTGQVIRQQIEQEKIMQNARDAAARDLAREKENNRHIESMLDQALRKQKFVQDQANFEIDNLFKQQKAKDAAAKEANKGIWTPSQTSKELESSLDFVNSQDELNSLLQDKISLGEKPENIQKLAKQIVRRKKAEGITLFTPDEMSKPHIKDAYDRVNAPEKKEGKEKGVLPFLNRMSESIQNNPVVNPVNALDTAGKKAIDWLYNKFSSDKNNESKEDFLLRLRNQLDTNQARQSEDKNQIKKNESFSVSDDIYKKLDTVGKELYQEILKTPPSNPDREKAIKIFQQKYL